MWELAKRIEVKIKRLVNMYTNIFLVYLSTTIFNKGKNMKKMLVGVGLMVSNAFGAGVVAPEPVEHKVVEIHMSAKEKIVESAKRRSHIQQIPLPGRAMCSGSFIDAYGDIITARHCVEGFDSFEVITYDNREYTAAVVGVSQRHDLALLHIDRLGTAYFELAKNVERGETVYVLGSPLGITDTLATGIIARLDGDLTLLDCSALPGNSGGPVFDKDGRLVAVASAGFVVMAGMTHLNIAQGLEAVWFFIQETFARK